MLRMFNCKAQNSSRSAPSCAVTNLSVLRRRRAARISGDSLSSNFEYRIWTIFWSSKKLEISCINYENIMYWNCPLGDFSIWFWKSLTANNEVDPTPRDSRRRTFFFFVCVRVIARVWRVGSRRLHAASQSLNFVFLHFSCQLFNEQKCGRTNFIELRSVLYCSLEASLATFWVPEINCCNTAIRVHVISIRVRLWRSCRVGCTISGPYDSASLYWSLYSWWS